jgi:small subunit ribosomal protein S9
MIEQFQDREYYEGIGRRKRSSARVRIYMGEGANGTFIVNGKEVKEFFPRFGDYETLIGQTGAVRLGLARALVKYDEALRGALRAKGHLTRDARIKERKKPGLKRARKAPTYTKR